MLDETKIPLVARRDGWDGTGLPPMRKIRVGDVEFGGPEPVIIAGPCAVESRDQILTLAKAVKAAGAHMLRGAAFKGRTNPYSFQGLGEEALEYLAEAKAETGLPVVTEVLDPRLIERTAEVADVLQVGCRSMQNFPLLKELGRQPRPVLLKRGFCATLEEWLCAAEYVAIGGNLDIILCERGIRTFASGEYSRNTIDLNVIQPTLRATHLPLILDPSHAVGVASMVAPIAKAGLAAGAQGLLVECRTSDMEPDRIKSDGYQAITIEDLEDIIRFSRECTVAP